MFEVLSAHNAKIDGMREGAGKFRDLEIGIGLKPHALLLLKKDLESNIPNYITMDMVNVKGHADFGKNYLTIHSYWME